MEKELRFIVNGVGELLDCNYRKLVARDKHTNIIQVIAPFNIDTRVFANIDVMASIKETRSELLSYKGKTESGFSIFEAELSQPNTKFISRHSSGSILISLSFSEKVIPTLATNYKGKFNLVNPLPLSAIDGDYYEADGGWQDDLYYYAFDKWVKGDIAYYYNGKWRRANYKLLANMSSVEIPVEPSIEVKQPIEEDEPLILTLAGDVANAVDRVGLVEIELTQQEDRIYNAELEAERLDDVKAEKSEVAISFAEVNDELIDINKELLRLEEDKTDKDELSEVAFSGLYDDLENTPTIPSISGLATEQWVLNKHYLTAHQSLADYYKKSEVNNLISQIPKFKILIVEELPSADIDLMAIYVVGSSGKEYIYLESEERWEMLGLLAPNLELYYTKLEADNEFVKQTININGKDLSDDITIMPKDIPLGEYGIVPFGNLEQALEMLNTNLGDKNVKADWTETDNTKDSYIENKPTIPNVSNFITKDVDNLTNYYDKTTSDSRYIQSHQSLANYYTKTEIDSMVGDIESALDAILGV